MSDILDEMDRERREARAPRTPHAPQICESFNHGYYSYRNWSFKYRCPICGRIGRFNKNFLGQRHVICDGEKFSKQPKREWDR